ncbi:spermatogenesis-associated protein 45 isoform X1 [Lontra canadensis]|uniref:spermatogenesis-associated protein 45 isoform X1 n=1 Tax=Lontra canadensis TaxID=76717 RepID=UPI0013F3084E|nr:spermatogenesis-associated protein 45 isoform X1 [Lontra canadensis]
MRFSPHRFRQQSAPGEVGIPRPADDGGRRDRRAVPSRPCDSRFSLGPPPAARLTGRAGAVGSGDSRFGGSDGIQSELVAASGDNKKNRLKKAPWFPNSKDSVGHSLETDDEGSLNRTTLEWLRS